MRFPAGKWIRNGIEVIATYNYHHDIYNSPGIGMRPIAHISYTRGRKKGGIDVFPVSELAPIGEDRISINKEIILSPKTSSVKQEDTRRRFKNVMIEKETAKAYGVQMQIRGDLPESLKEQIKICSLVDIAYFSKGDVAKDPRESRIEEVDRIIPITRIKEVVPTRIIDGGKQWFVPECLLSANIDFGKGCQASFIPGENAQLLGENLIDWYSAPWAECSYPCYATRMHKPFPKTIHKINAKKLEDLLLGEFCPDFGSNEPLGRPVDILRFGKRTEPWNMLFKENFFKTLETMYNTGTRGVIPTKFLPYRKDVAELLRKTKSVLLYGIGFDELEQGAVMNGCSNIWRLEQLARYSSAKVKAYPYLHILADAPPTKKDIEILNLGYKTQLLPLRFKTKKKLHEVSGRDWEELKKIGSETMFQGFPTNSVGHEIKKRWTRSFVHPDWIKIIGNNSGRIRMCHHNSRKTYCGGCFQGRGGIYETNQASS